MVKTKAVAKESVSKPAKVSVKPADKEDINTIIEAINNQTEAIRELTKVVVTNTEESQRWYRAGKM